MPERIVIIEFPDANTARRWYRSDDYQPALKVRLSTSRGRVFLIDGVEPALGPLGLVRQRNKLPGTRPSNFRILIRILASKPRPRSGCLNEWNFATCRGA
jgi:hypothetical protein